jgi:hypothetical protein
MKKSFDSLRPFEKRVVVGVGAALFVVLNFWFVFPHFSDWSNMKTRMGNAQSMLAKYQAATNQIPFYEAEIKKMASEGRDVPAEDQAIDFSRAITMQAGQSGVALIGTGKVTSRTNSPYFLELTQTISVQSKEDQLVDFLYNLGSGTSLIRVRGLTLRPDPPRFQLSASITLVASYQKAPPKTGRAAAAKPAPSTANTANSNTKRP